MNLFNPSKRADLIRSRMMKDGKYLIAKITSSVQETNVPHKILNDYFRYKDYMDNEEWFSAPLDEVWSPKFLGLAKDIWSVSIKEIKKLEFQNPPYSATRRLGGDSRDYNKVFTIQVAGCDYDCNFCYVPKQINVANPNLGKFFSKRDNWLFFVS